MGEGVPGKKNGNSVSDSALKMGDQEFKYTEFTLGSTLGTCTLSPSLTPPKFTEIVNLECHRMDFEASNQW